jgi:hypothetical protein
MRHYGAPSRLLDFSYSFNVATYFAINNTESDSAVFGVDHQWLVGKVNSSLVIDPEREFFQDPQVFWKYAMIHADAADTERKPFIIPVRPFRSNERIHVQQGLFLCPANVNMTFEGNLRAMFSDLNETKAHIFRIRLKTKLYRRIMDDLRAMNISAETLYPGLGGFAASLKDLLYLPDRILEEGRLKDAIKERPPF